MDRMAVRVRYDQAMRTLRVAPVLVLLALQLVLPAHASAWVSDRQPTFRPGSTIRFWIAAMPAQQRTNTAQAIRAWNASGGRFRLVASTRTLAHIRIMTPSATLACSGEARSQSRGGLRVSSTITWRRCPDPREEASLLAHELGHSLGLSHEARRCALMNAVSLGGVPENCDVVVAKWEYYCRVLEPDDVIGVVRRYGGTPRFPTGPRTCSRGAAPLPVSPVTATFDAANHDAIVSWTNPSGSTATTILVAWQRDTCPTTAASGFGKVEASVTPGAASATVELPDSGTFCVLVQPLDQFGQPPTVAATAMITAP